MQRINTLKECRTEQGLSQLELYALSGVSPNTLVAIEKYYHLPRPKLRQKWLLPQNQLRPPKSLQ